VNTTPYWLAEPREPFAGPEVAARPTRGSERVDAVVVGGGVTGCACALTLAEQSLKVRLLEAREIAAGASGRNGGFALRGAAMSYDCARAELGRDRAALLWQLTERALDRLALVAGDACRRVGSVRLAVGEEEARALERELVALREDGFAVECVDPLPSGLARLYSRALLYPRDAAIHPVRWVRRLAARAAAAGVDVVEQRPVTAAELPELEADAVVVTVDARMSELVPELVGTVWPLRGQVLATESLPELGFARPHYARGGFDYWQQLPNGRLLVGGRRDAALAAETTAREVTTPLIQRELEAFVVELLGELPRITHRWAGVWGQTRDLLPVVGRLPAAGNVWIAGGYSGHGVVLGLACGELVGRAILGERPTELELFDPSRLLDRTTR
jgi:glycine/D-amino acid oxidase-like deaminating enzyme